MQDPLQPPVARRIMRCIHGLVVLAEELGAFLLGQVFENDLGVIRVLNLDLLSGHAVKPRLGTRLLAAPLRQVPGKARCDDDCVRVLIPLPDRDFDVTEVAVPWQLLRAAGHEVIFATERAGTTPAADPRLLTGVIFGQLGAAPEARESYAALTRSAEFRATAAWADLDPATFDGLLLPGGHSPGMRQYLGSAVLREQIRRFWETRKPVGAICHGVLVLARTRDAAGRSALAGRRTTCLPKYMERSAYLSTAWLLGRYYRTYPAYVEDEVKAALDDPALQFARGPVTLRRRGTAEDDSAAFVVTDGNYVSARWPGDAYLFGRRYCDLLAGAS
jgi:putative intracellular protease/amidase